MMFRKQSRKRHFSVHSPLASFLLSLMISSSVLSIVCSTIIGSASTPTLNFGADIAPIAERFAAVSGQGAREWKGARP